jgi:hypothetical protein
MAAHQLQRFAGLVTMARLQNGEIMEVNTLSQATNPQTINNFSSVLNTVGAKKF